MAINDLTSEILIAAAGGHNDSYDNRVVSLNLASDTPSWTQRMAPSTVYETNVAYYADGKPSSRHIYSSLHFVPQVNRLILFGGRGIYGASYNFGKVDAFNLDTNKWDPTGTFADMPTGYYGSGQIRSTGEIISTLLKKWSPVDLKWTDLVTSSNGDAVRWPISFDSRRGQVFCLQWGDGQGYEPMRVVASRIPQGLSLIHI